MRAAITGLLNGWWNPRVVAGSLSACVRAWFPMLCQAVTGDLLVDGLPMLLTIILLQQNLINKAEFAVFFAAAAGTDRRWGTVILVGILRW
jgi:hypothetical protein